MSSLLCGGFFAAYVGWQMVSREFAAAPPGNVDTLAAAPAIAAPQVYMIVTATSAPQVAEPSNAGQPSISQSNQVGDSSANLGSDTVIYPQAVAPTPTPATLVLNLDAPPLSLSEIAAITQCCRAIGNCHSDPIFGYGPDDPDTTANTGAGHSHQHSHRARSNTYGAAAADFTTPGDTLGRLRSRRYGPSGRRLYESLLARRER